MKILNAFKIVLLNEMKLLNQSSFKETLGLANENLTYNIQSLKARHSMSESLIASLKSADIGCIFINDFDKNLTVELKKLLFLSAILLPHRLIILTSGSKKILNEIKNFKIELKKNYKLNLSFELVDISKTKDKKEKKNLLVALLNRSINKIKSQDSKKSLRLLTSLEKKSKKYLMRIVSGKLNQNQGLKILPSGQEVTIKKISINQKEITNAVKGASVSLVFNENIDAKEKIQIISSSKEPAEVANQFEVTVLITKKVSLYEGRSYLLKRNDSEIKMYLVRIKKLMDFSRLEEKQSNCLKFNSISKCVISTEQNLAFDSYESNPHTGSFLICDLDNSQAIGIGIINFALRRSKNIQNQHFVINKEMRAKANRQTPICLWFTGLSGSGKSTIANALEQELFKQNKKTYILDGDNIRHGINYDLGFSETDRVENIRRVAEIAKLMVDAGLIVIVTFISPFEKDRKMARAKFLKGEFFEIYISTPLSECEKRDPKGLYKKARLGEIQNFTGITSRYEIPSHPDLKINSSHLTLEKITKKIITWINKGSA